MHQMIYSERIAQENLTINWQFFLNNLNSELSLNS